MTSPDAERQELERELELLGRTTRPGRLLEYLGSKYFSQQETQLTEFDIAREVFGRSLQDFDPAEDAVVRVEAHRLRKKLRDIYEKDKRAEGVQIGLPAGTYVPRFTRIPGAPPSPASEPAIVANATTGRRVPGWAWALGAVVIAGIVIAGVLITGRPVPSAPGAAAEPRPA